MAKDYVTINRNPFGRYSVVRRVAASGRCDWCGRDRRTLYEYGHLDDARGRPDFARGRFCSVGCFKSYHDICEM